MTKWSTMRNSSDVYNILLQLVFYTGRIELMAWKVSKFRTIFVQRLKFCKWSVLTPDSLSYPDSFHISVATSQELLCYYPILRKFCYSFSIPISSIHYAFTYCHSSSQQTRSKAARPCSVLISAWSHARSWIYSHGSEAFTL